MNLLSTVLVAGSISCVLVSFVAATDVAKVIDASNHLRSDTTVTSSGRKLADDSSKCESIIDVICGNKDFKLMCESITRTKYGYTVPEFANSNKTFTIFAPTDEAYIQLDNPEWSNYGTDRFVNFHFYENMMLTYDELECAETIMSTSPALDESRTKCEKNGDDNGVTKYQVGKGNTKMGDQDLFVKPMILKEQSNIKACNAIIHTIDRVMLPATFQELERAKKVLTPTQLVPPNNTKVVYIIRHGEKVYVKQNETAYKYACESQQGWARAYNMKTVFGDHADIFETPNNLFSFNYDDETIDCKTSRGWYRTQATIAPLGKALDLEINNTTGSKPDLCGLTMDSQNNDEYPGYNTTCHKPFPLDSTHDYGPCCNVQGALAIKSLLFPADGSKGVDTVLASWEHANIKFLANDLAMTDDVCKHQDPAICSIDWDGTNFDKVWALYFDKDTQEFVKIDTNLAQGFVWIGPEEPSFVDYSLGPGEKPDID